MLTTRENALAILRHEQPDYYGDFMMAVKAIDDPIRASDAIPMDGKPHLDSWGVTKVWPVGTQGAHPVCTLETLVIHDIEEWEKCLKVPSLDGFDWDDCIESTKKIDRSEYFAGYYMPTGLFERSHFLMGMEDAFCNYLEYPDEMGAILDVICEYKVRQIYLAGETVRPDVFFFQDDWGHKLGMFLPPDLWRETIKPRQIKIAKAIHEVGALYVHHADCICQPVVKDMIEIGIDVWQGVIPQNDIHEIQRETEGRLAMTGGFDVPKYDVEGTSEEAIRAAVRECVDAFCPAGRFYPARPSARFTIGAFGDIFEDELAKYGRQWAQEHPIPKEVD